MTPAKRTPAPSFVLLCSDAGLSRAAMHALERRNCLPRLILLPEYGPAEGRTSHGRIYASVPGRRFPEWVDRVDIAYTPRALQQRSARLIRRQSIEFMLVACWPYLLARSLTTAVSRAALNLHPALLPAYRGPDPLGEQLTRGDFNFGVTLHELSAEFDRGDIIAQQALDIADAIPDRDRLERSCAETGVDLFIDAVASYPDWQRRAQPR